MGGETILKTGVSFENGTTTSTFEGRPAIAQAQLPRMAEQPHDWTPPHLYVASIESCFFLTMQTVAEKMRVVIKRYASTAEGTVVLPDGKHKEIPEVVIRAKAELDDPAKLDKLVQLAEEHCMVARSVKTKVRIEFES